MKSQLELHESYKKVYPYLSLRPYGRDKSKLKLRIRVEFMWKPMDNFTFNELSKLWMPCILCRTQVFFVRKSGGCIYYSPSCPQGVSKRCGCSPACILETNLIIKNHPDRIVEQKKKKQGKLF